MVNKIKQDKGNRDLLLKVMGEIIKEKRKSVNKGILLLGYEYDISSSSIALLEKGTRDVQITTLWKLVNALGMTFPEFITEVTHRLPEKFNMISE
ncbi:helix-turn-helix transcriptional regulator [bacterium]|nr:helix-turn-helix transcriptional regulator [bacterium]